MKLAASRWLIAVAGAFPLLCAYSCAVPLGPGYHIEKEIVELSFADQPQPRLHLRGRYRLENVGNGPLTSLDVTVPQKDSAGRQNLHVAVDGKEVQITERSADDQTISIAQISFDSPWTPHKKKDIEIACDLSAGLASYTMLARDAFGFDRSYWVPAFQAPEGLFAKGEQRADPTALSLFLPKDFLAIASGRQVGRKTHGETVEYRFVLREKDGAAFAVAGRYKQQVAKNKSAPVYFWTFQGLPEGAVTSTGQQIADAAQFFDSNFVARMRGTPIWVVEMPDNQVNSGGLAQHSIESFPNVLSVYEGYEGSFAGKTGSVQVSPIDIEMLADTWVKGMATPSRISPVLSMALRNHMVDAFYESRDGATYRQMTISDYLREYDMSPSRANEKPIAQVGGSDHPDQVNMAANKASLFLYALEDACGEVPFRRGTGVMITDLQGEEYGFNDLRAAIGPECGSKVNVDALFRSWLFEKGIPRDFRERYSAVPAQQDAK